MICEGGSGGGSVGSGGSRDGSGWKEFDDGLWSEGFSLSDPSETSMSSSVRLFSVISFSVCFFWVMFVSDKTLSFPPI